MLTTERCSALEQRQSQEPSREGLHRLQMPDETAKRDSRRKLSAQFAVVVETRVNWIKEA